MAVTITKKFHNGTEYKDIAKVVFTSPNFTSPAVAGTRSHMPPGGAYMGTWFEAVDWMYRAFPDQEYAQFPDEMESLFGKVVVTSLFDFASDTTISGYHLYGSNYPIAADTVHSTDGFVELNQTKRNWGGISAAYNGSLHAYTAAGLYTQIVGTQSLVSWDSRNIYWSGVTSSLNGDLFFCSKMLTGAFDPIIYKKPFDGLPIDIDTAGILEDWRGIASSSTNDIYIATAYGSIYKLPGGLAPLELLLPGPIGGLVSGITCSLNGSIYVTVSTSANGGVIYKLVDGTFISLNQAPRVWTGIAASKVNNNVYAVEEFGDIYVQIYGEGDFIPTGQADTRWNGIACGFDGAVYTCNDDDVYKMAIDPAEAASLNILCIDKDNYGVIGSSSVVGEPYILEGVGEVTEVSIVFSSTVGTKVVNEWLNSTVVADFDTLVSGVAIGDANPVTCDISAVVSGTADDTEGTTLLGSVIGSVTGIMNGTGTVIGTVSGTVSGELSSSTNDGTGNREYSIVSGTISGTLEGAEHGAISGTVSGTLSGAMIGPYEFASLQYTTSDSITAASTIPLPRRHHGGNSVIFAVSFGEAYDCRLTAWDDATHSTTNNKILAEEHYRVDAVAFRSNSAEPHAPVFNDTGLLVHPEAFDIPLKGNEKYFGDFDLIFAIDSGEYGEYVVFTPRLVNMDDSFIAGSYDFVTTLHYQYT